MPLNQQVRPGLSAPIVTSIPDKWSAQWFRSFITNYLQNADIRNATTTGGVSVTMTNFTQPPSVGLTAIPDDTAYGNVSGATAPPQALTKAQLTTLVNVFSIQHSGAVPVSPGGVEAFLRADGTWAGINASFGAPTALVGLLPVQGSDLTYLSSDSAPALDQSIIPTWTGAHTWHLVDGTQAITVLADATFSASIGIVGGGGGPAAETAVSSDAAQVGRLTNKANAALFLGTNGTDWLELSAAGGIVVNNATGGDQGVGTINAGGFYVNGVMVGGGGGGGANVTPDTHPTSPNAMDDEFEAPTLDPKWTTTNLGLTGASVVLVAGSMFLTGDTTGTPSNMQTVLQVLPTGNSTFRAKMVFHSPSNASGPVLALHLQDSGSGQCLGFGSFNTGTPSFILASGTASGAWSGVVFTAPVVIATSGDVNTIGCEIYIELAIVSGVATYRASRDGIKFIDMGSVTISTYITNVNRIGFSVRAASGTNPSSMTSDWFRRTV